MKVLESGIGYFVDFAKSQNDQLHEMFIIHTKDCYVSPHKHLGKVESMSILEGEVDVILFHNNGKIMKIFDSEITLKSYELYYSTHKLIKIRK